MGVVVTVDDVAGHLELIVHIQPVGLQLLVRDGDALVSGDHRLRTGVIAEGFRQEGLVRQHRYVYAVGQRVGARQQPGVVVHAEQVQQRGQDVRRGAVLIHHDVLREAGNVADKAVAILLEGEIHLLPRQLVVLILRQTVGIVVIGQYDAGLIGHARLLQPLQQVGQRVFQLQIAGDIRLHRLGIGQILHRVVVLGAHGVVPVVLIVAAEGHVIGVERLPAAEVVVHGGLHHLQIGGGPVDLYIQPGVRRLEGIAHVGVGDVPVVEIADIVVIAPGLVALFLQGVAQAEGQIVGARHVEAGIRLGAGHIRIKPHTHGVLAIGGNGLERAVVIIEDNARVGQLVQGGCQLLTDEPGAEALSADGDQIVPLQQPGVVVLPGGCHLRQVFVRGFAHGIIRGLRQLREVDALNHIIGIAAVEPPGVCTQRGRRDDDAAAAAEDHIAKLLHRGRQHTHALIAAVGRGVHIGEGFVDGE